MTNLVQTMFHGNPKVKIIKDHLFDNLQSCLRKNGDYVFYRCGPENLHSVIEINLNSLPEHYTEYFFESILFAQHPDQQHHLRIVVEKRMKLFARHNHADIE